MVAERKKRRWWIWTLGGIAGLLLLICVVGYVLLDRYAGDIVTRTLADANLPDPRLTVESIGLSESRLNQIRLGEDDALVADALQLEYNILDLIDLEPSDLTLRLEQPTLKMAIDETGAVTFGSLDDLLFGDAAETPGDGSLPFSEIVLQDATVLLETPEGAIQAGLNGTIRNAGDGALQAELTLVTDNDLVLFDGDISLTLGANGVIDGSATVREFDAETPWGGAQDGSGTVTLNWTGDGIPVGRVAMTFASLDVPGSLLPDDLTGGSEALRLAAVSLSGGFDGGKIDLDVAASDAGGDNGFGLNLLVPDVFAGGPATLNVDLSTSGAHVLWPWHGRWVGEGALTASVDVRMEMPPLADLLADTDRLFAVPNGQAAVQWILSDASVPGVADGISAVGDVTIDMVDGIAALSSADPVEVRIGALEPEMVASLGSADPAWGPILARDFAGQIDLAFEGRASRPLSVTVARREDGWAVRGDLTALAATGAGPLVAAEISGSGQIGAQSSVTIEDMSIYAADIETPDGGFGVLELAGRLSYQDGQPDFDLAGAFSDLVIVDPAFSFPRVAIEIAMGPDPDSTMPGALVGPLRMNFAEADADIEDVIIAGLSGDLVGRLAWQPDTYSLYFTEDAVFRIASMDIENDVLIPDPSVVRITASENPALELEFGGEYGWTLRHNLNIGPLDVRGSIRMGDERVQTALLTRGVVMSGGFIDGRYVMQIDVAGATGRAPVRGWAIAGGNVVLNYDDNDPANVIVVQANVASVGTNSTDGLLPAMGMRGRMDYGLDDIIRVTARTFDERNILIADVVARHDLNTNRGFADIEVQDLIFSPSVLQPYDISPLLRGFENVTGTVDIAGGLRWTNADIVPELALLVSDVTGDYDGIEFARMYTVIELASLSPVSTKPDQLLSIASVDIGMPITNAEVRFHIDDGDRLVIDSATLDLAEGKVTADQQVISFSAEEQAIDLVVTGVDLDALFAFGDLESLEAEGKLDGQIPIKIVAGDVVIPEAWLAAREPGFIRYDVEPDLGAVADSNAGVGLMVDLLKNFLYDELDLRLMRPVAGDMQVGFRILGRSPDVYGGIPIDLSLNVDGELEDVIRNSLELYRVPDTIQDLILEYGFDASALQ